MSALAALPTALVATHVFGALDFASHCRLARVDRRHCAISRLDQASPVELPIAEATPASVWRRAGLRPRRIVVDHDRTNDAGVGAHTSDGGGDGNDLSAVCARVDTLELANARDPLLFACATRLRTLRLHHMWDGQWRHVVATCGALTNLDVERAAPLSIDLARHPPPASLLALRFGTTSLLSEQLRALSAACPRLAFLEFNCLHFVECADALEFPHLTRLEVLCRKWPTDPTSRLTAASLPRLARLKLAGNGVDAHRALSVLTALEVLDARHSQTERIDKYADEASETPGGLPDVSDVAVASAEAPLSMLPAPLSSTSPSSQPVVCWPRLKSLAVSTIDDVRGIQLPFATLTELYVSPWNGGGRGGTMIRSFSYEDLDVAIHTLIRKLPTLRHLTLSRYGVCSASSFTSRDQTPIPARIDSRFVDAWNAILGPVLAAAAVSSTASSDVATTAATRSGLQTLATHCLAAVPDERGSLFRVHVPTLAAFLRAFTSRSPDTSAPAVAARAATSLPETDDDEEKFCGINEGDDDGNELLTPFAPCIRLADECAF